MATTMPTFDLTQLKSQITTMFFMKSGNKEATDKLYNDVFMMLYTICIMNGIEYIFKVIPNVIIGIKVLALAYLSKKSNKLSNIVDIKKKDDITASITLHRVFDKNNSNQTLEKIDGIIDYISNIDSVKHIRLDGRVVLNNKEDINILPNINVKILEMNYDDDNNLSDISILIYSHILKISDLLKWIDEVFQNYCFEKNNKLGKKKFYFNEIPIEPPCYIENLSEKGDTETEFQNKKKKYRLDSAPKNLHFTMNEFNTCKSFSNIFGDHVSELKERLDLFINHPEWYMTRGIPHSLGILLHGIPGAGKTSTIKAVAKDTDRHIFNLSLREYTTQKQLLNLFFNENIIVMDDEGHKQTYRIPLNQRIFVIEDIDCLTDIVYQRKDNDISNKGDSITLSFILNLLDGVLETPGRILIITSNYPEKLDKALIRPGRIDVKVEFKHASKNMIADIINNFYCVQIIPEQISDIINNRLSPAEVLESVCTYFKDYRLAIENMKIKAEKYINNKNISQETENVTPENAISKDITIQNIIKDEIKNNTNKKMESTTENKVENKIKEVNKEIENNKQNKIYLKRVLSENKNKNPEEYILADYNKNDQNIQPNMPMSVEYLSSLINDNEKDDINNTISLDDYYRTFDMSSN
jgi:hypothetical protein